MSLISRLQRLEQEQARGKVCNCLIGFDYFAAISPLLPDYRPGLDQSTSCQCCGGEVANRIRIEAIEFGGVTNEH